MMELWPVLEMEYRLQNPRTDSPVKTKLHYSGTGFPLVIWQGALHATGGHSGNATTISGGGPLP